MPCVWTGTGWARQWANGAWQPCPPPSGPPPLITQGPPPGGYPPPILPPLRTPPRPQHVASDERIYEATCFNIRTSGGFLSKTIRELVGSQEAQAVGIAICTYFSGQAVACQRTVNMGAGIVNKLNRHAGSDYSGIIRARPGYEICRAFWDTADWSVTSDTTFNTVITRTPQDNGLGYYVSMKVGGKSGNWIDTKVILEQVPGGKVGQYNCWATDSHPWLCKGGSCSQELPGARVSLPSGPGHKLCINH